MQRSNAEAHLRDITTAQREQREAAARYIADGHPLALIGLADWFAEEFILSQEAQP